MRVRSFDLTLMEIGHRAIPNDGPKRSLMQLFYRTYSGGQRPSPSGSKGSGRVSESGLVYKYAAQDGSICRSQNVTRLRERPACGNHRRRESVSGPGPRPGALPNRPRGSQRPAGFVRFTRKTKTGGMEGRGVCDPRGCCRRQPGNPRHYAPHESGTIARFDGFFTRAERQGAVLAAILRAIGAIKHGLLLCCARAGECI